MSAAPAALKIGDLIEVTPVRTVIRLEEGRSAAAEIASSFVFTPEAAAHFSVIAEALLAGRGQGYFLQGDFGSGKSHFLAALFAWLAGGEARDPLERGHAGLGRLAASGRRFLPVDVSLVNYRAATTLESIVTGSVRDRLAGRGGEQAGPSEEERRQTFLRLIGLVREAGYDGLVLLVDELSEFFRSKASPQALNEDARTLQLLGELAGQQPLWIVAAIQESIEATGDVSQSILRKIKDRFPVRLALSTTHVRALIAGRLVRRKPGADEEIARIYGHYRSQYATFSASFDVFRSSYPVHPATLSLLEGLGELFSQHRGIVDFVHSRIAGDPERAIPGILERPAAELLGPDSIYEHFSQRLAEFSAFHAYPRQIVPHLDEAIDAALASEDDRALARRLVRMLVLYRVHPTAETPTVSQLAELSACSIGASQPSLNARYVAEAVLDPVVRESRFLVRTLPPSGDPLQAVYGIAVEEDPGKLLDARLRTAAEEISDDDERLLSEPLAQLAESESWPGAAVWEAGARRSVAWNSSTRAALVRFLHGEPEKPFADRLAFDIAEKGFDFAVVLAIGERSIDCSHAVVWRIPRPRRSAVLREYLALRSVASRASPSSPADVPILALLQERMARAAPAAQQAALEALYAGEFSDSRIRVDPSVRQVKRFDRLLEIAGETLLEARYPRFREVAPRRILPSPRLYQQLLEGFVVPGSVPLAEARARSLSALIDGLAAPLGLVETRRGSYVFSPDASGYPLIPHLLAQLSSSEPTPMARVIAGLTGTPFGLPRDTAVFLVAALVIGGLLAVRKGGRAIPLDYLNLPSIEKADDVTLGELISEADRQTLLEECVFLPSVAGLETFGLRQQRDAWKDVVKFRESSLQVAEEVARGMNRMAEFSSFQAFGLAHLERTLTSMNALASSVKVSYPAKEGLEAFLRAWRGSGLASGDVLALGKLAKFLAEKAEAFIFVSHYVRHPAVEKAAAREARIGELRSTVLALLESPEAGVVSDGGEHLQAVFGQLREAYGALYAREHEAFYRARQAPELPHTTQRALDALRFLSGVETLDRPGGLEEFLRGLSRADREPCRRLLSEELLRSPLCGCGFAIGDVPAAKVSQERPEDAIERFLAAYCGILSAPRVLEAIAARAFALKDTKAASAARLKRLSDLLGSGAASPAALATAIDAETASELGRALAGRIPIRSRSLAALAGGLAGRRLPPKAILSAVSQWLAETSDDALIAVEADLEAAASDRPSDVSFWPLLHGELLARLDGSAPSRAERIAGWERRLEEALPAARLREAFLAAGSADLARFIINERLHTAAVRAAWLALAERVAAGHPLPEGFAIQSSHADPEKAGRITGLLAALRSIADLLSRPYPERLLARMAFEELLSDSWTTAELSAAIHRSIGEVSRGADAWMSALPPVEPIPLAGLPVVLIADGVPADVWMKATARGWNEGELAGGRTDWARLEAAPSTQESIASLFSLVGDPQEQLWLRDIPLLTLTGIEEQSLKERLLPLPEGRPVVVRLTLFDQAAHGRRLHLSEMAAVLAGIVGRDLGAVVRECTRSRRELILTTDHGLTLTEDGLAHGKGGAYERLIFRARWGPGPA